MNADIERADSPSSTASAVDMDAEKNNDKRDDELASTRIEAAASGADVSQLALEKAQTKHSITNVSSIPNGGLQAWMQVLGSFFLFFNTWGIINSFGSYQTYYESNILKDSDPSAISWIGSIQAFLLMLVGALTGPIYDAGYFRHLLVAGTFLVVFGLMMLSICKEYWQVLLAQAFCVGGGMGFLFVPSVAILSTYFTTRLSTATGIAAAGSSIGGVIYPIMLHRLIDRIGFPWTARLIGFIALITLLVPNLVMRARVLPSSRRKMLDLAAFREPPYTLFVFGSAIVFTGLYTPFFYIQLYALSKNITSEHLAFYMLSVINAGSTFGRVLPNLIADRTGPFNMMIPCAVMSGILIFCLIPISQLGPLIVFCVLYGFFSGTFVSLPAPIYVSLTPDRGKIGTRMGMAFAIVSIGMLVGTPIGGAIQDNHGFTALWVYGGVTSLVGSSLIIAARVSKVGLSPTVRA